MIDLHGIDGRISEITREVDFYSYLTPLNQEEERRKFFENLAMGKSYDPVFRYKDSEYFFQEKWLREVRESLDEKDDAQRLFVKKVGFLAAQLELLGCGDGRFTDIALGLYGAPDRECLDLAGKILAESKDEGYVFPEETVTPREMAFLLKKKLEEKNIDWKVALSGKIVPKLTVSAKDKTIYINSGINYTREEVGRLLVHEVEVHVYRGVNGNEQPFKIFRDGLAGYDETEEGLAIVAEKLSGCLESDTRQIKLYAGRAVAVDHCLNGSFSEAFMKLREYFPDYLTYRLVERCKRGLVDTSGRGAFTKDFHYISGLQKVSKYVEDDGDLSIIYVGKIGIGDIDIVRNLLDRGVLKPPKYLPGFMSHGKNS